MNSLKVGRNIIKTNPIPIVDNHLKFGNTYCLLDTIFQVTADLVHDVLEKRYSLIGRFMPASAKIKIIINKKKFTISVKLHTNLRKDVINGEVKVRAKYGDEVYNFGKDINGILLDNFHKMSFALLEIISEGVIRWMDKNYDIHPIYINQSDIRYHSALSISDCAVILAIALVIGRVKVDLTSLFSNVVNLDLLRIEVPLIADMWYDKEKHYLDASLSYPICGDVGIGFLLHKTILSFKYYER